MSANTATKAGSTAAAYLCEDMEQLQQRLDRLYYALADDETAQQFVAVALENILKAHGMLRKLLRGRV